MEDFVYFWRWVGFFLGIDDDNNICIYGLDDVYWICKEVENEIVYFVFFNLLKYFYFMVKVFIDGFCFLFFCRVYILEFVIGFLLDMVNKKRCYDLSFFDICCVLYLKLFVFFLKYCFWFRRFVNRFVEFLVLLKYFDF